MAAKRGNSNVLIISGIIGAVVGIAAGLTLLKRTESEEDERPMLTAAEGMSLGLLVVGLLRQISNLGSDDKK